MNSSEILAWVQTQNVEALRGFFYTEPQRPLIAIGSGGASSVCEYASLLYGATMGLSRAYTPLSAFSLGDNVIKSSKALLISHSGHNQDIVHIGKRCVKLNPQHTANLTTRDSADNQLKGIATAPLSFNYNSDIKDGFISVGSTIAGMALLLRAFKPTADLSGIEVVTPTVEDNLAEVEHVVILHGSWGQPIAIDLESKLVESGMMTCSVSDYRNFCHGRFIFPGNNPNTAIVMLITPREEALAQRIMEIIPENLPLIELNSSKDSAEVSIELLLQATNLVETIGEHKKINPNNPPNKSRIDKRGPKQIPYISTIKSFGELKL